MDKEKCGYVGWVSGWFRALRGPLGSQMVELGCQDTNWVGGNDKGFRWVFTPGQTSMKFSFLLF